MPDDCRIICRKCDFIEKKVIANEYRRLHRFRRNLRRLGDVIREDEDKDNGEREALDPFADGAFARRSPPIPAARFSGVRAGGTASSGCRE